MVLDFSTLTSKTHEESTFQLRNSYSSASPHINGELLKLKCFVCCLMTTSNSGAFMNLASCDWKNYRLLNQKNLLLKWSKPQPLLKTSFKSQVPLKICAKSARMCVPWTLPSRQRCIIRLETIAWDNFNHYWLQYLLQTKWEGICFLECLER